MDYIDHQRPFLVRDIELGFITLPLTPITVIIFTVSALILYRSFTKASSAIASHILLEGSSDEIKEKMIKMKKEINNNAEKFAQYAAKHSVCPSGKNGTPNGSLGKFKMGTMTPPFDKAVFSLKSEAGKVIGPVQTQFGYHLILIHEKDEQRQLVME